MSASSSPDPRRQARVDRLHRPAGPPAHRATLATGRRPADSLAAVEAREAEWTAAPPGRLGRRLLADVEPYLEFFAVAREN